MVSLLLSFTSSIPFAMPLWFPAGITKSEDFSGRVSPDCMLSCPAPIYLIFSSFQFLSRDDLYPGSSFLPFVLFRTFCWFYPSFLVCCLSPFLLTCHQMGSILQYCLIGCFAVVIVGASLISLGAWFHSFLESLTKLFSAWFVFPPSCIYFCVFGLSSVLSILFLVFFAVFSVQLGSLCLY